MSGEPVAMRWNNDSHFTSLSNSTLDPRVDDRVRNEIERYIATKKEPFG